MTRAVRKPMWNWLPRVLRIVPMSREANSPCAHGPQGIHAVPPGRDHNVFSLQEGLKTAEKKTPFLHM